MVLLLRRGSAWCQERRRQLSREGSRRSQQLARRALRARLAGCRRPQKKARRAAGEATARRRRRRPQARRALRARLTRGPPELPRGPQQLARRALRARLTGCRRPQQLARRRFCCLHPATWPCDTTSWRRRRVPGPALLQGQQPFRDLCPRPLRFRQRLAALASCHERTLPLTRAAALERALFCDVARTGAGVQRARRGVRAKNFRR